MPQRSSLVVPGGASCLRVDHLRQPMRLGGHQKGAVLGIEVVQRNDGERPIHGRTDGPPALVVAVGPATPVARRPQVRHEGGEVGGAAECGLHGPDDRWMFGNRGEPGFGHHVAADGVLGRFRIGAGRWMRGTALNPPLDDAAQFSRLPGGQNIAHDDVAFLVVVGDLLLAQ